MKKKQQAAKSALRDWRREFWQETLRSRFVTDAAALNLREGERRGREVKAASKARISKPRIETCLASSSVWHPVDRCKPARRCRHHHRFPSRPLRSPPHHPFFTVHSPIMSNVELGVQTEKAFQKQPIFQNSKAARKTTRDRRWYKDVGLGFKTPRAAIDGTYIGKHPTASEPHRRSISISRVHHRKSPSIPRHLRHFRHVASTVPSQLRDSSSNVATTTPHFRSRRTGGTLDPHRCSFGLCVQGWSSSRRDAL